VEDWPRLLTGGDRGNFYLFATSDEEINIITADVTDNKFLKQLLPETRILL
jgi:hypothetical protein